MLLGTTVKQLWRLRGTYMHAACACYCADISLIERHIVLHPFQSQTRSIPQLFSLTPGSKETSLTEPPKSIRSSKSMIVSLTRIPLHLHYSSSTSFLQLLKPLPLLLLSFYGRTVKVGDQPQVHIESRHTQK